VRVILPTEAHPVRFEGHTDSVPMNPNNRRFESNWDLSAARSILDVLAGRIPLGAVNDPGKQFAHAQSRSR